MNLYRDWRFDRWVRIVINQLEIFEPEVVNVFHSRIQFHPRQASEIAGKLLACLVEMVLVKMQITKRVDKIASS
jgi:hypothetical protein